MLRRQLTPLPAGADSVKKLPPPFLQAKAFPVGAMPLCPLGIHRDLPDGIESRCRHRSHYCGCPHLKTRPVQ
jgi:hypothetical protein